MQRKYVHLTVYTDPEADTFVIQLPKFTLPKYTVVREVLKHSRKNTHCFDSNIIFILFDGPFNSAACLWKTLKTFKCRTRFAGATFAYFLSGLGSESLKYDIIPRKNGKDFSH